MLNTYICKHTFKKSTSFCFLALSSWLWWNTAWSTSYWEILTHPSPHHPQRNPARPTTSSKLPRRTLYYYVHLRKLPLHRHPRRYGGTEPSTSTGSPGYFSPCCSPCLTVLTGFCLQSIYRSDVTCNVIIFCFVLVPRSFFIKLYLFLVKKEILSKLASELERVFKRKKKKQVVLFIFVKLYNPICSC